MRTSIGIAIVLTAGCGRVSFDPRDTVFDDAPVLALGPACPATGDLVACFDFDGSAADRTGRGNDPTLFGIAFVDGVEGQALRMDAASRADISTPNIGTLSLTAEAWIRLDHPVPDNMIVFDHDSHFGLVIDPLSFVRCDTTFGDFAIGATAISYQAWHHIAATYDDVTGTMRVYLDGVLDGTSDVTGFAPDNGAVAIGGNAPSQQAAAPFVGDLDRVRIWNRALSGAEIASAAGR